MSEEEWFTATDPAQLLEFLGGNASERKSRLFGCCCCNGIRSLLSDDRSHRAVEVAERFADGNATKDELEEARRDARAAVRYVAGISYSSSFERAVAKRSAEATAELVGKSVRKVGGSISSASLEAASQAAGLEGGKQGEYPLYRHRRLQTDRVRQSHIIREIFGNPFRPVIVDASWFASTVVMLARQMYESRDFSPMPILADALQDADCDDDEVLNHCRQANEHVRGCWVVDFLLGKE